MFKLILFISILYYVFIYLVFTYCNKKQYLVYSILLMTLVFNFVINIPFVLLYYLLAFNIVIVSTYVLFNEAIRDYIHDNLLRLILADYIIHIINLSTTISFCVILSNIYLS